MQSVVVYLEKDTSPIFVLVYFERCLPMLYISRSDLSSSLVGIV